MPYSLTKSALNDMEKLFELRARMLWSNPALAIVYGSYLAEALARPHEITKDGRIVHDNMRDIKSRTGLGRSTGTIANLTRTLEALGLLKIISMTKDSQDSMFMILTRPFLSELPQSFLSKKDFLGATNKEATQSLLSKESRSTPFFLSEVRLTQSVLKESILPMYLNSILVSRDKELGIDNSKVTNNKYFYSNTYSFLWGRNESTLGYQRLNPNQKVVLELVCTYQFDVDSLARYLGVRKNNLKSRILKPLGEYVRIEDGIITPRENLLEVLEEGFDQARFDNIQRTKREGRSKYREQQREHMGEGDKKLLDFLQDFLNLRREKKAARASTGETAPTPREANLNGHRQHYSRESYRESTEVAIAAQDLHDHADVWQSEEREAVGHKPEPPTADSVNEGFSGQEVKVPLVGEKLPKESATKNAVRVEALVLESLGNHYCVNCGVMFAATEENSFYEWWACDSCIGALREYDEESGFEETESTTALGEDTCLVGGREEQIETSEHHYTPNNHCSDHLEESCYPEANKQEIGVAIRQAPPETSAFPKKVPLAEHETVVQDESAERESSFDMVCRDIDGLGFKAWGTSAMKEVARVLLADPDILAPRSERVRLDGIKAAANGLALTDSDIKRALTELRGTCLNVLLHHYRSKW